MKKCQTCKGHKTVVEMGGIRSKCKDCKGLGFLVEAKPDDTIAPVTVITPFIKPHSKKVKITSVKVEQPI